MRGNNDTKALLALGTRRFRIEKGFRLGAKRLGSSSNALCVAAPLNTRFSHAADSTCGGGFSFGVLGH